MPAAVVAVAGMAAGSFAAATAVSAGWVVAGGIGAALISGTVGMAASSLLGSAIGADGSQQNGLGSAARGLLVNATSNVEPIPVIYGTRRLGGALVFAEVSGNGNEYLHLVIAHCEGPVHAIGAVYLDGVDSSDAKFGSLVHVERFSGAWDQTACSTLMAAFPGRWTSAHRGAGIAYTYVRLQYSADVFTGLPTITADIQGRTLYDPRDAGTRYSECPPLAVRDYLTNAVYGRGIPASDIDDVSFAAAANICDIGRLDPDGVTRPRHTCNGAINTETNAAENVRQLLTSCRGDLTFTAAGYGLRVDRAETPSSFGFSEDNITGAWRISTRSARASYNRVTANYFNAAADYQPALALRESTAFRAADNGRMLSTDIQLPFTDNEYEASILADRFLRQSRFGTTASFRATIAGSLVELGQVVPITHSTPGWAGKPFRVTNIRLLSSHEIEIEAQEYDDAVYAESALTEARTTPTSNLPSPATVPAPSGLTLETSTVTQPTGSHVPRLVSSWTAPDSAWVVGYDVAWREDDGPWDTTVVTDPRFERWGTVAGRSYDVRVRSVGVMGTKSAWVSATEIQAVPTTGPAAPTVTATGVMFQVRLAWAFGDGRQDVRATEIWFATSNDRATASRLTSEPFPSREYMHPGIEPGHGGYYWARVVDTWGNVGGWYPESETNGIHAVADSSPESLLKQLHHAVTIDELFEDLRNLFATGEINGVQSLGIAGNMIVDGTIRAESLAVDRLSSVSAYLGDIELGYGGALRQGQVLFNESTGVLSGIGVLLGGTGFYERPLFFIGDANGNYLSWNGISLDVKGKFTDSRSYANGPIIIAAASSSSPVVGLGNTGFDQLLKEITVIRNGALGFTCKFNSSLKQATFPNRIDISIKKNGNNVHGEGVLFSGLSTDGMGTVSVSGEINVMIGDKIQVWGAALFNSDNSTIGYCTTLQLFNNFACTEGVTTFQA